MGNYGNMLTSQVSGENKLDHIIFSSYPQINFQSFSISRLFPCKPRNPTASPSHQTPTSLQIPSATETERARERHEKMPTLTSTSSFLNPPTLSTPSKTRNPSSISAISPLRTTPISRRSRTIAISCNVALKQDSATATASTSSSQESEASPARIGAKVKVKVPIKVYHVPKVPEIDLFHMEGTIKQYVGLWKGKRISANLPFKVEFLTKVEGRDQPVKFVAHLREDEFDYLD